MENLISGKDALTALANGKEVLIRNHHWDNFDDLTQDFSLSVFFLGEYEFKLKPRTIKIGDIEVPAPFEPEAADLAFFVWVKNDCGYGRAIFGVDSDNYFQLGAWRTEDEIKQVVAALRKLIGA